MNSHSFYFTQDDRISVRALLDATGGVVYRGDYSTTGETPPTKQLGSPLTRYGFTGREEDPHIGSYYFRHRFYDASTARFLARDPQGYVDGMSLYAGYFSYSHHIDPTGTVVMKIFPTAANAVPWKLVNMGGLGLLRTCKRVRWICPLDKEKKKCVLKFGVIFSAYASIRVNQNGQRESLGHEQRHTKGWLEALNNLNTNLLNKHEGRKFTDPKECATVGQEKSDLWAAAMGSHHTYQARHGGFPPHPLVGKTTTPEAVPGYPVYPGTKLVQVGGNTYPHSESEGVQGGLGITSGNWKAAGTFNTKWKCTTFQ